MRFPGAFLCPVWPMVDDRDAGNQEWFLIRADHHGAVNPIPIGLIAPTER